MTKRIEVQDWKDKHNTFILQGGDALGYVRQVAPTEWKAFNADGEFIDWFDSKKDAINAL